MVAGRSAWNVFTSCCEFFPLLRRQGHTGIICSGYGLDGVLFESMLRKAESRHALFYDRTMGPKLDGDRELMRDMDWVFALRCKAHGCSNGVGWGLKRETQFLNEPEDAHIVVKSLINSSEGLHMHLGLHIERNVDFRPEKTDAAEAGELWRFFDVPDTFIDLFVEVDPWWDGRTVWVNPELAQHSLFFEKVSVVLAYCFSWVNWSDTRWVKCGRSARKYLRSEAAGIQCGDAS